MKIKVIEIKKDGKVGYLAGTNIFHENAVVDNPMHAIIYTDDAQVKEDLGNLYITGVGGAKSGIRADSADVVEFEIEIKEVARTHAVKGK
jgi:hypothetical protein